MVNHCLVCREEGQKGYFSMPKDRELRVKWINVVKVGDFFVDNVRPSHRVCYRHFAKTDIQYVGQKVHLITGIFF